MLRSPVDRHLLLSAGCVLLVPLFLRRFQNLMAPARSVYGTQWGRFGVGDDDTTDDGTVLKSR